MTEWKVIPGYERYEVSADGRVRNAATKRERKAHLNHRGYLNIGLAAGPPAPRVIGVRTRPIYCKVHRLVAIAFIPNPDNLPEVNHKDCNKTNNVASNLEWVDRMGNYWHAHSAGIWHGGTNPNRNTKFSIEIVTAVRERYARGDISKRALAAEYGMNPSYCSKVVRNMMRKRG